MVGRLLSCWEGLFSGAMLVLGRVVIKKVISFVPGCRESLFFLDEDDTMKHGDLFRCIIGKSTVWSGAFLQQNPLIRLKQQVFRGNKRKVLFLSWETSLNYLVLCALVEWGRTTGWWWSTTGWSDQWGGEENPKGNEGCKPWKKTEKKGSSSHRNWDD